MSEDETVSADEVSPTSKGHRATKRGFTTAHKVLIAALVVVVGSVGAFVIYTLLNKGPDAPVVDIDLIMEAAPTACSAKPLGYATGEDAQACQHGFGMGALHSWDEEEERWTTSEERDSAYSLVQTYLLEHPRLADLSPEQVTSLAWLGGFYEGIDWMENEAPRA